MPKRSAFDASIAGRATAPEPLKHPKRGVAVFIEHRELDRGILERADRRSPAVVSASRCVGFLEVAGSICRQRFEIEPVLRFG